MIRDKVYTLTEAAALLGVNRVTVRRWIRSGRLDAERIGGVVLIDRVAVEALRRD